MDDCRYQPESNRLQFLLDRDGLKETYDFAKRTMVSYRRQILDNRVTSQQTRKEFYQSYRALKQFVLDHKEKVE